MVFVISGPSGAGKSTLAQLLCQRHPTCVLSVSATTREPRAEEVDGSDYFFYSRDRFEQLIEEEALVEHEEYAGNYYGTPRKFLEETIGRGHNVVLDIEVKGAAQIHRNYPEAVRIFVLPPTPQTLVQRLVGRQTEDRTTLERRLHVATHEIMRMEEYDYLLRNDNLETTMSQLLAIVGAEGLRIRGGETERWLGGQDPEDVLRIPD